MANINNIPTSSSSSTAWIEWHKSLKKSMGKKNANIAFITAWDRTAGTGSAASSSELREYLAGNGLNLQTTALESATDWGSGAMSSIGDFFSFNKYVGIALGVIVVGGLGMIVFNVAKQPVKAVGEVAKLKSIK